MYEAPSRLARRLNLFDAVILGLGSMIGAGIFSAVGPAAKAAGSGLLFGLVLAGGVAFLNATTMTQLASVYPESGGAYVYGRKLLGPAWGFMAGWSFVAGKLASCTAMALTFAHHAFPQNPKVAATAAALCMMGVNLLGVRKTATVTKLILAAVLGCIGLVLIASYAGGGVDTSRLGNWTQTGSVMGILQSAGMLFFAFAGYARIATLGEEVIEPQRTIPRAMIMALTFALIIYALVMMGSVLTVSMDRLAQSQTPLVHAVESGRFSSWVPAVRVGGALASLGVLLSLMAGVSRTVFAMSANQDLPRYFARVHSVFKVPYRAEWLVGFFTLAAIQLLDLRTAIGLSSFAVLIYYAIANLACLRLNAAQRRWPMALAGAGFIACILISLSLPAVSVFSGLSILLVGFALFSLKVKLASK